MDAKQFLAEFEYIAGAPGGVQGLRGLMLDLAIQGKLIESDSVGDAASSLQRIALHKENLIKRKIIKRPRLVEHTSMLNKPFSIPLHWEWEQLGNLSYTITDGAHKTPNYLSKGVPFLSIKDISNGSLSFVNSKFISEEEYKEINKRCNPERGDILFCRIGTLGRCLVVDSDKKFSVFVSLGLIKFLQEEINSEYLCYVLNSPYMYNEYEKVKASGSHTNKLNLRSMLGLLIPYPPLEEQSRIVVKVDELMALCDKLETQQQQKRKLQNHLRQSTLQALASAESPKELQDSWDCLSGSFPHLFAEPSDVNELKNLAFDITLRGFLPDSHQFITNNPSQENMAEGWAWSTLGDLAEYITSGSRGWKKYHAQSGSTFIRSQDIRTDALVFDNRAYVDLPEKAEGMRTLVRKGDLLITITGGNVGKCALVPELDIDAYVSQHVALIRLNDTSLSEYIHYWIVDIFGGRNYLARFTYGDKPGLNLKQVGSIPIPIPPPHLINKITPVLNSYQKMCENLAAQYDRKLKLSKNLANSVIASLTGITTSQQEAPMKAPKTELIAPVRLGKTQPTSKTKAPLATLLIRHNGDMSANDLWQRYGGEIDDFYAQLKTEVGHGWITEPTDAKVLEKEADE